MISCGVPDRCDPEAAAAALATFGLDMIRLIEGFESSDGYKIRMRVGIHSGPVMAAVIGRKMVS
jgi:class 3 adenylate cyclase